MNLSLETFEGNLSLLKLLESNKDSQSVQSEIQNFSYGEEEEEKQYSNEIMNKNQSIFSSQSKFQRNKTFN